MNRMPRRVALVFLSAVVSGLALSVGAQQPSATRSPAQHVPLTMPVNPPPGWDPQYWATLRAECQEIADKVQSHIPLSSTEDDIGHACMSAGGVPNNAPAPPPGSPIPGQMPIPTPHNQDCEHEAGNRVLDLQARPIVHLQAAGCRLTRAHAVADFSADSAGAVFLAHPRSVLFFGSARISRIPRYCSA